MSTASPYVPRDYRRACDQCGVIWNVSQLSRREDGMYYCPDDNDRWTAREKDRLSAQQAGPRWRQAPTVRAPHAEVDTFQAEEGRILDLLNASMAGGVAPYQTFDVTNGSGANANSQTISTSGYVIIYCYGIVTENTRPAHWITNCKSIIKTCADYLITKQFGQASAIAANSNYTAASTAMAYGGVTINITTPPAGDTHNTATVTSGDTGLALLAWVYAYRVLGDFNYILAARMAATCLRRMQRGDAVTTQYATTTVGGTTRLRTNMFTNSVSFNDLLS